MKEGALMKKWLVPLVFPFISIASLIAIYALADWANGDGTGYGGVVYGLIGMIFYCVIVIPAICIAYSKCCLSGQKFRLLFILYQSFLIGFPYPYYNPCFIGRNIFYAAIFFAWCVLWGLIGLVRLKRKKDT